MNLFNQLVSTSNKRSSSGEMKKRPEEGDIYREIILTLMDPYHPLQVFSSSLLMKTSSLRLKLVELNFLVSFNTDDQS